MQARARGILLVALLAILAAPSSATAIEEPDRLWMVGERAFADALYPLAERVLQRFVDEYPTDARTPDAVFMLGKTRLAMGAADAALQAFQRAQSFTPPPPWRLEARFWEGEALFRLKRFADARIAYDDVLRTDAASKVAPEAFYGLAWTELESQHAELAAEKFAEFVKTWPDHSLVPSAMLYQARALLDAKRPAEAVPVLSEFATRFPNHRLAPDAQYLVGVTRLTAGDRRAGLADLRAFVAAHPSHRDAPAAQRAIAEAVGRSGDREELQERYKTLLAQSPPTAEGLAEAVDIAGRLGRAADQDAAWKKLRATFPEHRRTRRLAFDLADRAFRRKEWKEAAGLAQIATATDDDALRPKAWLLVGESELKLKRFPAALKAFEAVTSAANVETDDRYRALAGTGLAHEEQQAWRPALTAYETVASKSPDATLREWARERAAFVKSRTTKPAAAPAGGKAGEKPGGKPTEKPNGKSGARPGAR